MDTKTKTMFYAYLVGLSATLKEQGFIPTIELVLENLAKDIKSETKIEECRYGHICTSACGNDYDCPCQVEHCCVFTSDCEGCDEHYQK